MVSPRARQVTRERASRRFLRDSRLTQNSALTWYLAKAEVVGKRGCPVSEAEAPPALLSPDTARGEEADMLQRQADRRLDDGSRSRSGGREAAQCE